MNLNRLKGALVERGKTYADIAKVIGISKTAFNEKINGRTKFSIEDANVIADHLGLSNEERIRIFFDRKLEPEES